MERRGPPLGMQGLPPGHPYHQQTDLAKAPSPSPGRPGTSSKPTFASALRDLAKNAGEPEPPRRAGPPTPTPVASSLQDVRKGFDRGGGAPAFSPLPPYSLALPASLASPLPAGSMPPAGFQPYRPPAHPGLAFHPGLQLPPGYPGLPPEADPMYQVQVARYLAAVSSRAGLPAGYPGAGFPGVAHLLPPGYYPAQGPELAMLHDQLRAEELRRLGELEAMKEAELRGPGGQLSPLASRPPTSGEALHRLSRIAAQPGGKRPAGIPPHIRLPTKPLDFSELAAGSAARPVTVVTPSPPPSPAPLPALPSASRCLPYTPKPRDRSRAAITAASTPKKQFVRPFEDSYSPIAAPGEAEVEVKVEVKVETELGLEDIERRDEQEDSDYESMSSDSSIKKEGEKGMVCPTSGHLLPDHTDEEAERKDCQIFREPEPELPGQQRDKLKYLRYFRLTTHRKKNDIEIEKLEKRKSLWRERSPSPPPAAEGSPGRGSPALPLPSVPPHLNRLPDSHPKAMYLSAIGLCRNSEEQKAAHEVVWGAVLEDRLARDGDTPLNKYFHRLRSLTGPGRGTKRAWGGGPAAEAPGRSPPPALRTQLNIPSCGAAMSRLHEEPRVSLPSSVEIHLCSLQPIAQPSLLLQEVKQEPGLAAPPAHLQRPGGLQGGRSLALSPAFPDTGRQEPEDLSQPGRRRRDSSPVPWQGVDAIMESYHRFRAESDAERAALLERSSRAGAEVLARRCQVDTLSTRLSSLARLHKTLVGNHGHTLLLLEGLHGQLAEMAGRRHGK